MKRPKGKLRIPPSRRQSHPPLENTRLLQRKLAAETRSESRRVCGEILSEGRTPIKIGEMVWNVHLRAREMIAKELKIFPPENPPACKQGCAFCCHLSVETSIPEVLVIGSHLGSLGAEEQANVKARIDGRHAAMSHLSWRERMNTRRPCPLLEDGVCSVYEVRPLACRGWNSSDVGSCEKDMLDPHPNNQVPTYWPQTETCREIGKGLVDATSRAGLDGRGVDLGEALWILANVPDAPSRWLAGEDVFRGAWTSEG